MSWITMRLFASYGKVASTTLATFSLLSAAMGQEPAVRWVFEGDDPRSAYVEVRGAGESDAPQKRLTVHARSAVADPPPMLGSLQAESGVIRFRPQFPLERGMSYRAVFQPVSGAPIVSTFDVPRLASAPSTVVRMVYPSADVVPENLLKFYIQFSAPMSRGNVYDYINLLDSEGKEIDLPFLQLNEELWDPDMTRLTLLFDPGRIKRGVQPLEQIGPALVQGRRFSLVIDAAWKDATGQPLKEPFRKDFTVGPADRTTPYPARWKITPPPSDSKQPLRIEFGEPMEHALALRMIRVVDGSGNPVAGQATLDDHERRWNFTPDDPWPQGLHRLVVRTTIEDLAGNNIGKPFDVDLATNAPRQLDAPTVQVSFEIR